MPYDVLSNPVKGAWDGDFGDLSKVDLEWIRDELPALPTIAASASQLSQAIHIHKQEFHTGLTSESIYPKRQMRRRDLDVTNEVCGSVTSIWFADRQRGFRRSKVPGILKRCKRSQRIAILLGR